MYLGFYLTTRSEFSRGVNKTFVIMGRYIQWNGTFRRFGRTYPSHFQKSTNYQSSQRKHPKATKISVCPLWEKL